MTSNSSLLARVVLAASVMLSANRLAAFDGDKTAQQQLPNGGQQVQNAQKQQSPDQQQPQNPRPCHWWQFGRCDQQPVEGLPDGAPREGTVVTVDLSTNTLYLFRDGQMLDKALVATGSGKFLKKGRRFWLFHTPEGRLKVLRKIVDPIWTKPDWAFIEEGKPIPPPDSPKRRVKGHLGKYALDLGDGIMIHGTDDVDSFGRKVSHGCIRVPDEPLEHVYESVSVGTPVFIFQSQEPSKTASNGVHSDLDYLKESKQ